MNLKQGCELSGGRYRILDVIGQGGFGITYLGEQTSLGRKVAIKEFFMRDFCERDATTLYVTLGTSGSRESVERFRQKFIKEATCIAALEHKGIVSVIDVFEENGTAYYVMKYYEGDSLADKVKNGALPEETALRYIREVAEALDYLHGLRIMHLDIKPANILVDSSDSAVLIDFGLSKQYDEEGLQTSSTPVGLSVGYAPLEQSRKGGVGTFSPATDIYSLGATLYKLVTGETPPEASDVNDEGLPVLPDELSLSVRYAIESAMQPRRKDRPQSVAEFLSILDGKDSSLDCTTLTDADKEAMRGGGESETSVDRQLMSDNGDADITCDRSHGSKNPAPDAKMPKAVSHKKRKLLWPFFLAVAVVVTAVFLLYSGNTASSSSSTGTGNDVQSSVVSAEESFNKGLESYEEGNYKDAVDVWKIGAESGHPGSLVMLGACYFDGTGVDKSYVRAVELWKDAAKDGNDVAQFFLGECYNYGYGVDPSYEEAIRWYTMSAEQGNEDALNVLQEMNSAEEQETGSMDLEEILGTAIGEAIAEEMFTL